MTINEYQKEAMRSVNLESLNDRAKGLSNTGLGITGEAGEVADLIKKHLHHGHELDKEHLAKEPGSWSHCHRLRTGGYFTDEC